MLFSFVSNEIEQCLRRVCIKDRAGIFRTGYESICRHVLRGGKAKRFFLFSCKLLVSLVVIYGNKLLLFIYLPYDVSLTVSESMR